VAASTNSRGFAPGVPVLVVAVLLVVGGGLFWRFVLQRTDALEAAALTPEAKAYTRNLQLSDVKMKAAESYLKQSVVEIAGKITNAGDRPLQYVALNCVFYDPYGQVVLRERVAIVRSRTGGLKPGETKEFRLAFDSLAESWNQAMPQLVIAQIIFG
jgi:hypothetical protein